jgi:hypothetical protein
MEQKMNWMAMAMQIIRELQEGYDFLIENQNNAMDFAHHSNIEKAKLETLKGYILEIDKERNK